MDNAIGLGIMLSLKDKASAGLDAIRNRLTALRDVSQEMMKKFDEGAKQMIAGFASMATGSKILGVINKTFGASVNTAVDFEQAMARVGAVSGATGEDFEQLTQQAKDLGRETQFSASQAAASQENLARAGFKTNEILNAMPGLLNMAAAEGMDLANAADIASSAIRGFGLDASEANRVADVLAKTSSASNTSIALLGESLKYVAKPAAALGFSIEQTNAMLGVMANSGIKGSQAGTALKAAFLRLSQEPKRVAKALDALGVSSKDAKGNLRAIPDLMVDLGKKMEGMGKATKLGYLANIFGAEAASGMLAIMESVADGSLPELEEALYGCSGAAQQMAERMNATAKGAMLRLESASEGLRIVIGNHLLPVYTWMLDKLAQFKSWLTQLIEEHPIISKAVIGFTTALLGLSGAMLLVVGGLASISGFLKMWPLLKVMAISALSNIRNQARLALGTFSKLNVPVVGMIALAGALFYAWRKNLWGIRDMVTAVAEGFKMAWRAGVDGIVDVDDELVNKLKAAGIWDYAVTMGQVFFRVRQFWNGLVEGFKEGLDFLKGGIDWLKSIFSPVIESGQELLKFLGILKPVTETHTETWKAWGQLIGRIAPIILTVIAAFKGIKVITGLFGTLGKAIGLIANPIGLTIVAVLALVAAGIYLYNHWEEISAKFSKIWNKIAGYGKAAADWIKRKWKELSAWWNSWELSDVFAPLLGFVLNMANYVEQKMNELAAWWDNLKFKDIFAPILGFILKTANYVEQKMNELSAWWDNLKFSDIFAPIYDFAVEVIAKVKQPFIDFKNWLLGIFANLNPFNWELPSWLGGGGKVKPVTQQSVNSSPQGAVASGIAAKYAQSYGVTQTANARANGGLITRPEIALIGEAGREIVIPLENKSLGVQLWQTAGQELGLLQNLNVMNSSNTSTASSVNNLTQSTMNANVIPHAKGGIFSQPHIGLVAEAGREAIIPLEKQARGTQLWFETGRELGLIPSNKASTNTSERNVMPEILNAINLQPQVSNIIPHAKGGIFSQPHIGLVAEAGREAVIPLEKQARGTQLWFEAGRELGLISSNTGITNTTASNAYNVLPEIVNALKFQPDFNLGNGTISQPDIRLATEAVRELDMIPANTTADYNVVPEIVNALKFQTQVSNFIPHAEGRIFSQPHIGLIAEAGHEAVSPLENEAHGVPLFVQAAQILGIPISSSVQATQALPSIQKTSNFTQSSSQVANLKEFVDSARRYNNNNNYRTEYHSFAYPLVDRQAPAVNINLNEVTHNEREAISRIVELERQIRDTALVLEIGRTLPNIPRRVSRDRYSQSFSETVNNVINTLRGTEREVSYNSAQTFTSNNALNVGDKITSGQNTVLLIERAIPLINSREAFSDSHLTAQTFNNQFLRQRVKENYNNTRMDATRSEFSKVLQQNTTQISNELDRQHTLGQVDHNSVINSYRQSILPQIRDRIVQQKTAQASNVLNVPQLFNYNNTTNPATSFTLPVIPHADGGIFSTPHWGLVAEAGKEAVIPLENKSRGLPLLWAAMTEIIGSNHLFTMGGQLKQRISNMNSSAFNVSSNEMDINQPYSSSMLIQNSRNQAFLSGQASAQSFSQNATTLTPASSNINVNADIKPADVYIDGERVGRIMFKYVDRQNTRNGVSPF